MCLTLSQLLALSAFPLQGNLTGKIAYNELMDPDPNRVCSYFQNFYPYINSGIFIVLRGAIGAVTALFSYSLTFVPSMKRYLLLLLPMLIFIVYSLITSVAATAISDIALSNIVGTNCLTVNSYGSIWVIVAFFAVETGAALFLMKRGGRDDALFL